MTEEQEAEQESLDEENEQIFSCDSDKTGYIPPHIMDEYSPNEE